MQSQTAPQTTVVPCKQATKWGGRETRFSQKDTLRAATTRTNLHGVQRGIVDVDVVVGVEAQRDPGGVGIALLGGGVRRASLDLRTVLQTYTRYLETRNKAGEGQSRTGRRGDGIDDEETRRGKNKQTRDKTRVYEENTGQDKTV